MAPEEWKAQQPKREASFKEKVGFTILGGLIVALGIFFFKSLFPPPPPPDIEDDPDRPPIIVRNGSVKVEVSHPGSYTGDKGKLIEDGGKKFWYHDLKAKEPKEMEVSITGVTSTCSKTEYFYAPRVTKIVITYGPVATGSDRTLTFGLANKRMEMTPDAKAKVTTVTDYSVEVDKDDEGLGVKGFKLKSAELYFKKKPKDANDTPLTCVFAAGGDPQITLIQSK
jgi:hypothetical protein